MDQNDLKDNGRLDIGLDDSDQNLYSIGVQFYTYRT